MKVTYVYKGTIIGGGNLQIIPREGNFVEIKAIHTIYKVEAVMFKTILGGDVVAIIYLSDVMDKTKEMLRNYK